MKKLQQLHAAAQANAYVKEHTPDSATNSLMELIRPILNQTGLGCDTGFADAGLGADLLSNGTGRRRIQ